MKFIDKVIYKQVHNYWGSLALVILLLLLTVGLETLAPWPFKLIIDNIFGSEPIKNDYIGGILLAYFKNPIALGFFVVFLYFIIHIFLNIFQYFSSITLKRVVREIIYDFSQHAFYNLQQFNIGFFRNQSIGDYIYKLSYDVYALGEYIEEGLLPILTSGLFIVATLTAMFFISVKLTLIALVSLPFLAGGLYYFNKRLDRATAYTEYRNSAVFSFVEQSLNQLKIVQSFTQEKKTAERFNARVKTSLASDLKWYKLDFLLNLFVGIIIALSYAIIIANGISDIHIGVMTTGVLVVFIFYLDNLTQPILSLIFATSIVKQTHVKISNMHDFFSAASVLPDHGTVEAVEQPSIEFRNVTLRINDQTILKDISFAVPEKSLTVVIGVSGSGKSSIISLISRLIDDPIHGEILIGGQDIKNYKLHHLRQNISYVQQEVELFDDTIYNNIVFGNPEATKEQIIEAAKMACAHDFIEKHKGKYDFRVGERGNFLSGGQRQRVLLARAFLKEAKIVILDEPLSYLDLETRKQMWQNIWTYARGKTLIMVTNIMDVVSQADLAIVINEGRLLHVGKHSELLKKSKEYGLLVGAA